MTKPAISVVIPVYNNKASLEELTGRITNHLAGNKLTFEIVYVDDASIDGSFEVIKGLSHRYPCIKYFHLDCNSGQQLATIQGLERASGERIVVMDADLQDQPELIAEMNALCAINERPVFILRTGTYQSIWGMLTSRLIKIIVQLITGLHYKAGGYFMIPGLSLADVLSFSKKCTYPYISIIAGSSSSKLNYLKANRSKRDGISGYTLWKRVKAGYSAIHCALCTRVFIRP